MPIYLAIWQAVNTDVKAWQKYKGLVWLVGWLVGWVWLHIQANTNRCQWLILTNRLCQILTTAYIIYRRKISCPLWSSKYLSNPSPWYFTICGRPLLSTKYQPSVTSTCDSYTFMYIIGKWQHTDKFQKAMVISQGCFT